MTDAGLAARLTAYCRSALAGGDAAVADLEEMPGHSGFSYGFTLVAPGAPPRRLVIRLAPPNVRFEGPADVARQGRLLLALEAAGLPVPHVVAVDDDPRWFDRPFFVTDRLPGATVNVREPEPAQSPGRDGFRRMAEQAVAALVALHGLDRDAVAPGTAPLSPEDCVLRWDRFHQRAADPELARRGPEVRAELLRRLPSAPRLGLTHGDFQWANLLYQGERLVAVMDWELAGAGPVLNDLGWLMVFSDRDSWAHTELWPNTPAPADIAGMYAATAGADLGDIAWHRALAGYSFGVIAGFNLMLHRRGKRPDPHYELMVPSIPRLFERAAEVLAGAV